MDRRSFAKVTGTGLLTYALNSGLAYAGCQSNGNKDLSRVPLGVCNHSLRAFRPNADELLDFAVSNRLDSILMNTLTPLQSLEKKYLDGLKKRAQASGVGFHLGVGSVSELSRHYSSNDGKANDLVKKGLETADMLGSPVLGCRIGSMADRYTDGGIAKHMEQVSDLLRSFRSQALDLKIRFAFENHMGDLRSKELRMLIEEVGTDICGALFDPANAVWAMEDPIDAMQVLGSRILSTSVRDVMIWQSKEGASFTGTAIGEGVLNYCEVSKFLQENCQGVPLHVETISNSIRPIPFLGSDFWDAFPDLKAGEIKNFLKLARKGKSWGKVMPEPGMDPVAFDKKYQKSELQKSLLYLRENCGVGLKGS